jgi:two-component system, NarL family, nitrate/nitrite response regulator NarL
VGADPFPDLKEFIVVELIRVLLADDHPLIRSGIGAELTAASGMELVGTAANADDAYRLTRELNPHVLLLDLNMPGPSPLETVAMIQNDCPDVKVIVLTAHDDDTYVRTLVGVGVDGYVFKDEAISVLVQAIRTVVDGGTWFSQSVVTKLVRWKTSSSRQSTRMSLTDRELDVLRLMVNGNTDQEISQKLGLADRTVRYRLRTVYTKLEVKTRVEAAVQAVRLKLVEA